MSKPITIVCEMDGKSIKTDSKAIERSEFFKDLLKQFPEDEEFKIPQIRGETLELIVEWLEKHKTEEPKEAPEIMEGCKMDEVFGEWEDKFMTKVHNKSWDHLFRFLNACNFLNIEALSKLGVCKLVTLTEGFSAADIKKLFKIEDDCTDDDIKKIEEEVEKELEEERKKEEEEELKREEEERKQEEKEKEEKEKLENIGKDEGDRKEC